MKLSGRDVENVNWMRNAERSSVETMTTRRTTNARSIECSGSKARIRPELTRTSLLVDLRDEVEHRHVHRDDDRPDDDAEDRDHHGLHELHEAGDRVVDLFLVELRDLVQHLVEGARLLAHRREDLRLAEGLGDGAPGLDGLPDAHDRVLDDRVSRGLGGDLETVEDRHARGGERRERAAESRDSDLPHDVAEDRRLQDDSVDDAPAAVRRVVALQEVAEREDPRDDEEDVARDEVRGLDDETRRERQLGAEGREQRGERRNDLPQDDEDDDGRDREDGDGVDESRLDLALQLDGLLDVGREAAQDRVEDTARLAGGDHIHEEVVERLGVLTHRLGERGAGFDVLPHGQDDLLEEAAVLLAAQDLEALHERQAGVDHDRELAREDREAPGADAASAELRHGQLLALLLDRRDVDLPAPEVGDREILRIGDEDAARRASLPRAALPDELRHEIGR